MVREIVFTFLCCFYCLTLNAQERVNPFEIRPILVQDSLIDKSDSTLIAIQNPFELREPATPIINLFDTKSKLKKQLFPSFELGKTTFDTVKKILFWMLLFLSFLLALALNLNRNVATNIYRSFTNINFFSLQLRDAKEQQRFIYFILYGLYFLGVTIYIYLGFIHFKELKHPYYLIIIAACVCLVYMIRHLSLLLFGRIFAVDKEMYTLSFSVTTFGCLLGILLIPTDFLIAFINPELARKVIFIVAVFIVLLYIVRIGRDILICSNLWRNSIFHFLLYLCSFEIAPILIIWKILKIEGVLV